MRTPTISETRFRELQRMFAEDPIEKRRARLMDLRDAAVSVKDWPTYHETTKRLAKLPVKTPNGYDYGGPK